MNTMKLTRLCVLFLSVVCGSRSLAADDEQVTVVPIEITENRAKILEPRGRISTSDGLKIKMRSLLSSLTITLRVEGKGIDAQASLAKVALISAVDNLGTDLKPAAQWTGADFWGHTYGDMDSSDNFFDEEDAEKKGVEVDIRMKAPPRKAEKLLKVKGELHMKVGGRRSVVVVKDLRSHMGKKLTNPELKQAGLDVTILDPTQQRDLIIQDATQVVMLQTKGSLKHLRKVEILDTKGKSISSSHTSMTQDSVTTHTYKLDKPLDTDAVLKLHLLDGQMIVKVPFELKDTDLP